jgi:iron(III) transport system substrate-binding protein
MMSTGVRHTTVVGITTASLLLSLFLLPDASAQDKGKTASNDAVAALYAAAKKEGTVVIWGPSDPIIYQKAQERLNKEYPGIKIEHFESLPEPIVQRLIAEGQAGKASSVDIVQSGSLRAVRPLIDRDMIVAYPGWEKDFGLDAVYAGNRFVGNYNLALPIAYNTKLVSAQEAPKNWEDLTDSKWKGRKIILEARLVPFAMLGTEIGKAKALELAKKILAQDPIIVQGGTTALNALAGGQAPIAVGVYAYAVNKLKRKGATIEWVPVSPLPLLTSALAVVKTAPHPNAGRFFAGWMGSLEGQKIIYEYSGQATLVGKNAYGPEAEKLKTARPKIILETDRNFAAILEVQRALGKLAGALR